MYGTLYTHRASGITHTLRQAGNSATNLTKPCRGTSPPAAALERRFERAWLRPVLPPVSNSRNTPITRKLSTAVSLPSTRQGMSLEAPRPHQPTLFVRSPPQRCKPKGTAAGQGRQSGKQGLHPERGTGILTFATCRRGVSGSPRPPFPLLYHSTGL